MNKGKYYDVKSDIERLEREDPLWWVLLVTSNRGAGKTYSTLRYMYENDKKFIFMKRTNDDVAMLCSGNSRAGSGVEDYATDLSPFKPLNRDFGWCVRCLPLEGCSKGIAGFFTMKKGNDGKLYRDRLIGYCLSCNSIVKFKGFDMSECDYIIFDEFIPRKGERYLKNEGDLILDLYMTVARDREERGRCPLRLICLANATNCCNPIMLTLNATDTAMDMQSKGITWSECVSGCYLHDLGHEYEASANPNMRIYLAMKGTPWAQMAFEGDYSYNDISDIVINKSIKGWSPLCAIQFRSKQYYAWISGNLIHWNRTKHEKEFFNCDTLSGLHGFKVWARNIAINFCSSHMTFCGNECKYAVVQNAFNLDNIV